MLQNRDIIVICAALPKRGNDCHGSGYYGAPRGSRIHVGQDYECQPGDIIISPTEGTVTKIGYPYADDLKYRYVEVTFGGLRHRIFYIKPMFKIKIGTVVNKTTKLGVAQALGPRYEGITEHIHYEVIVAATGEYRDPNLLELMN